MPKLQQLYEGCADGQHQPSDIQIQSLLEELLSLPDSIFVLLNALDECTDGSSVLDALTRFIKLRPTGMHVLATSRPEREIEVSALGRKTYRQQPEPGCGQGHSTLRSEPRGDRSKVVERA